MPHMAPDADAQEAWERLLAAERRLQGIVPEAVLVGGTAAALHAGHRISLDGDHVLGDLRERFPDVLKRLESTAGWKTERIQPPVLILGSLDGCLTGLRQQIRARPLEVERRRDLKVPTLPEMVRIKAWLCLTRNTTRDLLDTVALLETLGEARLADAFSSFDSIYERGPGGGLPLVELIERLSEARPTDQARVDLRSYRSVKPPWNDLDSVTERARSWAGRLARLALEEGG